MKRYIVLAFLIVLSSSLLSAQDKTSDVGFTPYSIFGIGEMERPGTTYNLSMGGVGIGDRNVRVINIINPAAITARDDKSFMMDFGVTNSNLIYRQGDLKSGKNITNLRNIVATMPIGKHSAFKLGLVPYSNSGYKFVSHETSDELIAQVGDIKNTHYGEGSIYQAFLGGAVTFFDRLSVGADFQYYFGHIDRHSDLDFNTGLNYKDITSGWEYVISAFNLKAGLQYSQPVGSSHEIVFGATYALKTKLKGRSTRYAFATATSSVDTISYDTKKITDYYIPGELGFGFTFKESDRWKIGFDYTRQDWRGMDFEATPSINYSSVTSNNFRVGFEYTPNRYDVRYYSRRITYRAGAYHERTYMSLDGKQITATGLTLGASFPVFRFYNAVNVGIDLGQRGSLSGNLVRERYIVINVGFNLHDIWFIKPLYN
ncbi:MAG: hypothetical protein KBS58_06400 [Bacteroidales bacterium]|nr:hypothetical protein [Candidatus Cacconaster equi]